MLPLRRGTIICLVAAALISLAAAPMIRVVVRQIELIVPEPLQYDVYLAVGERLARTPRVGALAHVLHALARDPHARLDLAPYQARDPANGLYEYLHLLMELRQRPASAEPDTELRDALERCLAAGPAVIHAGRERQVTEELMREYGLPPRAVAARANETRFVVPRVRYNSIPVARELAHRLIRRSAAWRVHGHAREADDACRVVVRLLTDLLADDASREPALLAARKLPPALWMLGAHVQADQAAAFRQRLHALADRDELNLLPWLGDLVMAAQPHERAIRSLIAVGLSCVAWATTAVICGVLMAVILIARPPPEHTPTWRWPGAGWLAAAAIVAAPVLITLLALAATDIPFTWLISKPSTWIITFVPAVIVVSIGLAAWLCTTPGDSHHHARMPAPMVAAIAGLLLATGLLGTLTPVAAAEPWRSPALIARLRWLAPAMAVECAGLALVWIIWSARRRRRAGVPRGAWARPVLAAAAAGLLGISFVALSALIVNTLNDRRHEQAFVAAAADPLADQLGPDWQDRHFGPARRFIETAGD